MTVGFEGTIDHLTREELDGFFIHLDADCLDDVLMPAVDFRMPGGLSWDELRAALRVALASGKAVGLEITIYNPRLDEDGSAGRGLTDVLAQRSGRLCRLLRRGQDVRNVRDGSKAGMNFVGRDVRI